jgi:hypothetical protein
MKNYNNTHPNYQNSVYLINIMLISSINFLNHFSKKNFNKEKFDEEVIENILKSKNENLINYIKFINQLFIIHQIDISIKKNDIKETIKLLPFTLLIFNLGNSRNYVKLIILFILQYYSVHDNFKDIFKLMINQVSSGKIKLNFRVLCPC